jgi:quinolinate synthase
MRQLSPGSTFYPVPGMEHGGACLSCNNCPYMKMNTLEKLYQCMARREPEIVLPDELMKAAKAPLERMLEMSGGIPLSETAQQKIAV